MNHYIEPRRAEEWIRREARDRGFRGDPLDPAPPQRTIRQELLADALFNDMPRRLRDFDPGAVHVMCRAAVMGESGRDDHSDFLANSSAKPGNRHPAIERANRQAMARRTRKWGRRP